MVGVTASNNFSAHGVILIQKRDTVYFFNNIWLSWDLWWERKKRSTKMKTKWLFKWAQLQTDKRKHLRSPTLNGTFIKKNHVCQFCLFFILNIFFLHQREKNTLKNWTTSWPFSASEWLQGIVLVYSRCVMQIYFGSSWKLISYSSTGFDGVMLFAYFRQKNRGFLRRNLKLINYILSQFFFFFLFTKIKIFSCVQLGAKVTWRHWEVGSRKRAR